MASFGTVKGVAGGNFLIMGENRKTTLAAAVLVLATIPLSNVVPAVVIALISLAYLEEDGLLLSIALLAAVIVLTVALRAIWETFLGAKWFGHPW